VIVENTVGQPPGSNRCCVWRARCRERHGERHVRHGRLGVCLLAGLHYLHAL